MRESFASPIVNGCSKELVPTLPSATVLSESAVPKRTPKNVKPEVGAVVNVSVEPERV